MGCTSKYTRFSMIAEREAIEPTVISPVLPAAELSSTVIVKRPYLEELGTILSNRSTLVVNVLCHQLT